MPLKQHSAKTHILGVGSSFFGVEQGDRPTAWVDHFDFGIANFDADDARAKLRELNLKYDSSNSKESFEFFDPDGFQVQLNGPDYVGLRELTQHKLGERYATRPASNRAE